MSVFKKHNIPVRYIGIPLSNGEIDASPLNGISEAPEQNVFEKGTQKSSLENLIKQNSDNISLKHLGNEKREKPLVNFLEERKNILKSVQDFFDSKIEINDRLGNFLDKGDSNVIIIVSDNGIFKGNDLPEELKVKRFFDDYIGRKVLDENLPENLNTKRTKEVEVKWTNVDAPSVSSGKFKENLLRGNQVKVDYMNSKLKRLESNPQNNYRIDDLYVVNDNLNAFESESEKNDGVESGIDVKIDESKVFDSNENSEEEIRNKQNNFEIGNKRNKSFDNSMGKIKRIIDTLNDFFPVFDSPTFVDFPNTFLKQNFKKRVYRNADSDSHLPTSKTQENSDEIKMSQKSILNLLPVSPNQIEQQSKNFSSVLWLRYQNHALIFKVNKSLIRKKLKNSDIFKLLNVSISNLKKLKMYNSKCVTCSVLYKMMLDRGFKIDSKLTANDNSSVIVVMNNPKFLTRPLKPKLRVGIQNKFKKTSENIDYYTVQAMIDMLFMPSDEYQKLTQRKLPRTNFFFNGPWRDSKKIVFKIPDSFISQSRLLSLNRSLKHKFSMPFLNALIHQDELTKELQKILFAILTKMHESDKITIKRKTNHSLAPLVVKPTLSSEISQDRKIEASLKDQQESESKEEINLKEKNYYSHSFPNKAVLETINEKVEENGRHAFPHQDEKDSFNGLIKLKIKEKISSSVEEDRRITDLNVDTLDPDLNSSLSDLKKMKDVVEATKVSDSNTSKLVPSNRKSYNVNKTEYFDATSNNDKGMHLNENLNQNIKRKMEIRRKDLSLQQVNKEQKNYIFIKDLSEKIKNELEKLAPRVDQMKSVRENNETVKETNDQFTFKDTHNATKSLFEKGHGKIGVDNSYVLSEQVRRRLRRTAGLIRFRVVENQHLHNRRKREFTSVPHNNWCPIENLRRNGDLDCLIWTTRKKCKLECHPDYNHSGQKIVNLSCVRKANVWKPDINQPCILSSGKGELPKLRVPPDPFPGPKGPEWSLPLKSPKLGSIPDPGKPNPKNEVEEDDYYDQDYYN